MNEILLVASLFVIYGCVLLAYRLFGKSGLYCFTAIATITANIEVLIMVKAFGMEQTLGNILFASTFLVTDIISEIAKMIEPLPFQILDINMGCPVPKIVKNGEGSALMLRPELVYEIVSKTAKAIKKPVTVKIRKGFDDAHINAVEIAKVAEEAGAKAVAVHGRTREQYYSGKADWDIIRQVKAAVSIPVIGNGDVTTGEQAIRMREETGCDGVMIGRGAQGNPWIFRELLEYEKTGKLPERPSPEVIRETMLRHARLQMEYKGDFIGIREMRKHVAWYTKGMKGSSKLRDEINRTESYEELEALLYEKIK